MCWWWLVLLVGLKLLKLTKFNMIHIIIEFFSTFLPEESCVKDGSVVFGVTVSGLSSLLPSVTFSILTVVLSSRV